MPFVIKQITEHGTRNPIVARLGLQTMDILKHTSVAQEERDAVGAIYLDTLQPKLLRCWEIKEHFRAAFDEKLAEYAPPQGPKHPIHVPQIPRLEQECHNFLYEGKNFVRGVLQVYNELYGTAFEEASELSRSKSGRPTLVQHATDAFGANDPRTAFIRDSSDKLIDVVWMRNAVEHDGGYSGSLIIENFELSASHCLRQPSWRREKNGLIEFGPSSIKADFERGVHNMLIFAEDMLASWADGNLVHPHMLSLQEIPEEARDPVCPVRYTVSVRPDVLAGLEGRKE